MSVSRLVLLAPAAAILLSACAVPSAAPTSSAPASSSALAPSSSMAESSSPAPSTASPSPSPATSSSAAPTPTPTPTLSPSELSQWATGAKATSEYGDDAWSAAQATGEPNVEECGDSQFAWATEDPASTGTLTLTYDVPVVPSEIVVRSTYNPGQIKAVYVVNTLGKKVKVWKGKLDKKAECPLDLTIDVTDVEVPVDTVIVQIDQSKLDLGWTEIDAVQLTGMTTP